MGRAIRRSLSVLDAWKEQLSARLGEALYRLYVQEHNPFFSEEVVKENDK